MNKAPRILIPILTGLGNCVMLTPLMRTLRQLYPAAELHLFTDGRWNVQELLRGSPLISGIHFDVPTRMNLVFAPRISSNLSFILRARAKNLTATIIAHAMPADQKNSAIKNTILKACGARLIPQPFVHESEQNLALLDAIGVSRQKWVLNPGELAPGASVPPELSSSYIVVQPGASNGLPTPKRWPTERWIELLRELLEDGREVVLLGDKAERTLGEQVAASLQGGNLKNLCGATDIPQMLAVIKGAKAVIAADSGLGHLAGALGVPLISIWGPTSWTRSSPMGNVRKVSLALPCAPCTGEPGQPGEAVALERCPRQNACMKDLAVDQVTKELRCVLGG